MPVLATSKHLSLPIRIIGHFPSITASLRPSLRRLAKLKKQPGTLKRRLLLSWLTVRQSLLFLSLLPVTFSQTILPIQALLVVP